MKTREFNRIKPYTYFIIRKSDNKKYHGLRIRNVKKRISPMDDLGISYFSSGSLKEDCKKNPKKFIFIVKRTFNTVKEASLYEEKINKILIRKDQWKNWLNKSSFPHCILTDESREILSKKTRFRVLGKGNPMYGKTHSISAKKKISQISKKTMNKPEMKLKLLKARLASGYKHSEETKNKIRESQLGSKSHLYGKPSTFRGRKHTEESKKKISEANKGYICSAVVKKKISQKLVGRIFSEEHKKKISEKLKGRIFSEEHKKKISEKLKEKYLERR